MKSLIRQKLILILIFISLNSCDKKKEQPWFMFETDEGSCGYIDIKGDTMIAAGKYLMCFTDTLVSLGIVLDEKHGIIGINKDEDILYNVFNYDNGPDYISEGLFRILINDKIGFANKCGTVKIKPQYACAYPFEDGKARVSFNCSKNKESEYSTWVSNEWFYIDTKGNIIQ